MGDQWRVRVAACVAASSLAFLLAFAASPASADTASASVGAYSVEIHPGFQTLGICLCNSVEYTGTVVAQTSDSLTFGSSAVDLRSVFAPGKAYYAEIDLGPSGQTDPHVGHRVEIDVASTIAAASAGELFVDLASRRTTLGGLPNLTGYRVRVRRHIALSEAIDKTTLHASFDLGIADQVQFWDGEKFVAYYLLGENATPMKIWGDSSFAPADDLVIPPGEGLFFKGSSAAPDVRSAMLGGAVRVSPFAQPLPAGFSLVSEPHFRDASFAERGALDPDFTPSFDLGLADQAQVFADAAYKLYFFAGALPTVDWLLSTDLLNPVTDQRVFLHHRATLIKKVTASPDYRVPAP